MSVEERVASEELFKLLRDEPRTPVFEMTRKSQTSEDVADLLDLVKLAGFKLAS